MQFTQKNLPETTKQSEILALIHSLNQDPLVHGIIVQSPIQCVTGAEEKIVMEAIDPRKDVDG